jgi:hypothetical protein
MNRQLLATSLYAGLFATAALAGCNPYDPDLGNDPFECGSGGECPEGYECMETGGRNLCVAAEPSEEIDGPSSNFQCANDSAIEPNNDPQSAFVTPIPQMVKYSLVGLAVCPVGDKDHFRFDINSTGLNFEAQVTGVANRPSLSIQVLNSSGTMIGSGAPVAGSPQVVRIEMENRLAAGTYSVLVQSPDNTENNYDLVMKVCATPLPCPP